MWWPFSRWNQVIQVAAAWASIAGLLLALVGIANWPQTTKEAIYAAAIVLFSLGCATTSLIYTVRLGRRVRFAEAVVCAREAARKIGLEGLAQFHTADQRKLTLSSAMDDLSKAFSILTGSNCRCCVKTMAVQGGMPGVLTLCREGGPSGEDAFHLLDHNSDFDELYHKKDMSWYLGNDLPSLAKDGNYHNTSKNWKSRYVATAIWPIRRAVEMPAELPELFGFLCVDSKKVGAFSEEYDFTLGALVADALLPFLARDVLAVADQSQSPPAEIASPPSGAVASVATAYSAPDDSEHGVDDPKPSRPRRGGKRNEH